MHDAAMVLPMRAHDHRFSPEESKGSFDLLRGLSAGNDVQE
jgi:hypothetical protein